MGPDPAPARGQAPSAPGGPWTPLPVDASTRRYFAGPGDGRPVLLADFGEDADGRERFLHVAGLFSRAGIRVPEIIEAPQGETWVVQERIQGRPLSRSRWREDVEDGLLSWAGAISDIGTWGRGPAPLELDAPRLAFELGFFRLHFVEGLLNTDGGAFAQGLDGLARAVGALPMRLAHRDFHSENILEGPDGERVLIDFQDALWAPAGYDAASLAVDAYRDQGGAIRRRILAKWAQTRGSDPRALDRVALQRALKALGTFGYQVTRLKRIRFLAYVAPTCRNALDLLGAWEGLEDLAPVLRKGLALA